MKKLLMLVFCIMASEVAFAQKDSLAFDEHGKYIYYKVVSQDKFDADSLFARASAFFKKAYNKSTLKLHSTDEQNKVFKGIGIFTVSNKNAITKHDDGQVAYTLNVEIKGTKYRYWLTDFVFTPYVRDRYNNFVPQSGVEIPLEHAGKNVDIKDLNIYLNETGTFAITLGNKLKWYMQRERAAAKVDTAKKVIKIDKW